RGSSPALDTARGRRRCSAARARTAAPRRATAGTAGKSLATAAACRVRSGHPHGNRDLEPGPAQPGPVTVPGEGAPDGFGPPTDRRSTSRTTGRTRRNGWLCGSSNLPLYTVLRGATAGVNSFRGDGSLYGGREPVRGVTGRGARL